MRPLPVQPEPRPDAGPHAPASDAADEHASLRRTLDRTYAENLALRRQVSEQKRQLDELHASTSWRITAPLRAGTLWLRRLLRGGDAGYGAAIDPHAYQGWIRACATIDDAARRRLTAAMETFAARPLISVIMPSYNVDPAWLSAAIASVRGQIYPHWELCVSDDASTMPGVRELLQSCAAQDPRIRVNFRATNGHISANSNSALDLATGDYVALMDADDLITPDALFWVAHAVASHPDVDLIFSDEDKIDETGRRFDPYFKGAWSPALMTAQNAFCHLGVYRRSLVERVGRFREGFEGAQDHDLVLRCAEVTTPERIRHIPRILYHWRALPQSTAKGINAKSYALDAGRRAVEEHFARSGTNACIDPARGSFYQVVHTLIDPPPFVSIIMPSTLRGETAARCLASVLEKSTYRNFELLILAEARHIEAAPPDMAQLLADPRVRVVTHEVRPFNYSQINNLGAAQARGAFLCLLNDDIEVITDAWLEQLVARASQDDVGIAAPMLYYPSGLIQHGGIIFGIEGTADHAFRNLPRGASGYFGRAALEQDYSAVTAACLVVRRGVYEQVGGFDVSLPVAFNDVDFCIRVRRAGVRIVWTPAVEMMHHESATLGAPGTPERRTQFARDVDDVRRRWADILDHDPYYSPNLSLGSSSQFQLASPPRIPYPPDYPPAGPLTRSSRTADLS